jgi:hypothetical protein
MNPTVTVSTMRLPLDVVELWEELAEMYPRPKEDGKKDYGKSRQYVLALALENLRDNPPK